MHLLLALLACSGDESDVKTVEQTPPPEELLPTEPVAPPPAAPSGGESRTFDLDAPGGAGGAPDGAAFIVPGGANAETTAGALSDGSSGMKLVAKAEGDALICTQPVQLGGTATIGTRMKVSGVKPGPQNWMGMNVELRARDASGALVSPAGSRYVMLRNDRAPTDWIEWELPVSVPAGASQGEVCFRFVNSTGTVEVDRVVVKGADGAAPVGGEGAPPPSTPAAPAGPATRWDLDAGGGGGGAPAGFDFLVPPGTAGTTAKAGPVAGGTGFSFSVTQPANSLACSQPFPVSGPTRAAARVRVAEIKTDARPWTGFVAEVRTYDGAGALVSPNGSQFTTVGTVKSAGEWAEVGKSFTPPTGAATGKLCFRFVESTGTAEIDWAEAGPG